MTKRTTPALMPLSEDPTQPQFMRELLQAGRDTGVSDYNFEQGLSKHLALIDAGAPTPHWAEALRKGAGAAPTAAGSSLLPWLAAPVVAAAIVTAAVLVSRHTPPQVVPPSQEEIRVGGPVAEQAVPAAAASANAAANAVQPNAGARKVVSPAQPVAASGPSREASSARTSSSVTRVSRNDKRVSPSAGALGSDAAHAGANSKLVAAPASTELFAQAQPAVPSHSAANSAGNEAHAAAQADKPVAAAAEKPEAQVARNVPAQPAAQDDSKLEREMAMLAMAQRVLLTDPARALGLARQGESEFAGSMFTQERQQLLLLSLVRLGRLDEAKRLAKPYLTRYPAGPFSDRVRRALATGKVER